VLKGELDQAIHEYLSVLKDDSNFIPAILSLATGYLSKKDYKNALVFFQKVLKASPDMTPDIRLSIGYCYHALDRIPQARHAYTRALERVYSRLLMIVESKLC
jgi:RNA polymerase-associated protein CTR9